MSGSYGGAVGDARKRQAEALGKPAGLVPSDIEALKEARAEVERVAQERDHAAAVSGSALARAEAAEAALVADRAKVERVRGLVDAEVADTIESRVRGARADVRCIDCNLRHEERQDYGCHEFGRGHSFDDGDLDAAEEIERSTPVEYVTLPVADLLAALDGTDAEEADHG